MRLSGRRSCLSDQYASSIFSNFLFEFHYLEE
jgi:hypothetical protein